MKRGKLYAFISMVLIFSLITSTFAYAMEVSGAKEGLLNPPARTAKEAAEKGIKVIHKTAPAPSSAIAAASWTENKEMYNQSSFTVQTWTKTSIAIAMAIAAICNVYYGAFMVVAGSIYASTTCAENQEVYYKIYYYWQPSDDPQLPYYIKQVFKAYSDRERTDYLGSKTNYYYSSLPF